jgi:hypothetical protein
MPIHYIRPDIPGELRDPFGCDEQVAKALVTVGALVALADGTSTGSSATKRSITSISGASRQPSRDSALLNSSTRAHDIWRTGISRI